MQETEHGLAKLAVISFFLVLGIPAFSQESRVLVQHGRQSTASEPVVLLKWYSKELIYPEGVNVYRREQGTLEWVKLNERPIRKKATVEPAVLAKNPDIQDFVELANSASQQELQEDIIFFNVVIKSFQSNAFADFLGIYFEDRTVKAGHTYEYRVNKLKSGREQLVGITSSITAGPYAPPPPVRGVELAQHQRTLAFNWIHEDDRYYAVNIYRSVGPNSPATKINNHPIILSQVVDSLGNMVYPKPMFSQDRSLEEGTTYVYQVAGLGFFEDETEWSTPVQIFYNDVTPPPAPKNLQGKADSMKVHLQWEVVPAEDLKGLKLYRSTLSDGPYEPIAPTLLLPGVSHYTDSLTLPSPYYYFLASVDTAGNEAHSDRIFVEVQDVVPPLSPKNFTIEADTGKITLRWAMNNEPDLAGYYIYRTADRDIRKNYVLMNAEPLHQSFYEDVLPKNVKSSIYYYIVAVDTSFNRSKPSIVVSARMPDILPPEKPFIKAIAYTDDHIVIDWIPNVDTDLAGYHIFRSDTSKNFVRLNINLLGRSTFRYTDRDHEANRDYYYYLVAVDSSGNTSPKSNVVYGYRAKKETIAEGSIKLVIKQNKRRKQNKLLWAYSSDEPIQGYVVYRGDDEKRLQPITGLIKEREFVDKVITTQKGAESVYQVRAYKGSTIIYSPMMRQKF